MKNHLYRGPDTQCASDKSRWGAALSFLLAVSGLCFGLGIANAQTNGGSGRVINTPGFNCAPGTQWTNDGGVARCQVPTAPAAFLPSCPSLSNFNPVGACLFDFPATAAGVTVSAPTKTTTHIGQTTLTCNAGTWGTASTTCTPIPTLTVTPGPGTVYQGFNYTFSWVATDAASVVWSCAGSNPSSGSLPATGSRSLPAGSIGATSCVIEATGAGGSSGAKAFSFYTDTRPGCAATSYSSGNSCIYPVTALNDGASLSFPNATPGYTGTVTGSCSMGTWTFSGESCNVIPPSNCSAQVLPAYGCSFSFGSVAHGASSTVNTSTGGFTGSATASCTNGTLSITTGGCSPTPPSGCAAQTMSSGACSYDFGSIGHGGSTTASTSTAGFTGTATAVCNAGVLSMSSSSCAPVAPADCAAQSRQVGACNFDFGAVQSGSSSTVNTSTAGYTGQASASCSNGVLTVAGGATCDPIPSAGCAEQTLQSGSCSFPFPPLGHGGSDFAANIAAGFTGSATATCSNGTLVLGANSCGSIAVPTPPPSPPASGCPGGGATSYGSCSFAVGPLSAGYSQKVGFDSGTYTGVATATCNGGVVSWSQMSCDPKTAAGSCPAVPGWVADAGRNYEYYDPYSYGTEGVSRFEFYSPGYAMGGFVSQKEPGAGNWWDVRFNNGSTQWWQNHPSSYPGVDLGASGCHSGTIGATYFEESIGGDYARGYGASCQWTTPATCGPAPQCTAFQFWNGSACEALPAAAPPPPDAVVSLQSLNLQVAGRVANYGQGTPFVIFNTDGSLEFWPSYSATPSRWLSSGSGNDLEMMVEITRCVAYADANGYCSNNGGDQSYVSVPIGQWIDMSTRPQISSPALSMDGVIYIRSKTTKTILKTIPLQMGYNAWSA